MTFRQLRQWSYPLIIKAKCELSGYDFLVKKHTKWKNNDLLSNENQPIDFDFEKFKIDLERYLNGEPIQKIINYYQLANLKINLKHKVLIPRFETEQFIYHLSSYLKGNEQLLDLGTGSGFIGLALKKNYPNLNVTLIDNDPEAIKQTRINAKLNNLKVNIYHSDWFSNVKGHFDIIVSNPPYLNRQEKLKPIVKNWDPKNALFAPNYELEAYNIIIKESVKYFSNNNCLLALEIGFNQSDEIEKLLVDAGYQKIILKNDLANQPRFIFAFWLSQLKQH